MSRLSLNQWTIRPRSLAEAVDGCVRHDIASIGLWRDHVAAHGLTETAALVRSSGLRVSSLCRGGFFNRPDWLEDNRRAIEEAAELEAACLVLVPGGLPAGSKDLSAARSHVAAALATLAPYASEHGVRLAVEPMHPMYCADRSVISTLAQALEVAPPSVGVVVDCFHVWWDPDALSQITRAGDRIASFQLSDFLNPLPADVLLGRAMMGDGVIDFAPLCAAVDAAGYTGDVEVEIFNADVWAADPDEVLPLMKERYASLVERRITR
ncbi:sugar phosphate isomerase/epimerase [Actinomadura sp. DC4]|uniref:sugar phosphate isomerase/epimerase family protein n=1 Tax=Actinomadura sp. DC4 TaxID=3055069 RepID=UPI0025B1065C|nr:sugar phosphate isomerase/epimerase [Actinomadura sp. DC4]MDN3358905.1 sugar phosphate isomerase/epimerase [Actinomadura sp. DC4]